MNRFLILLLLLAIAWAAPARSQDLPGSPRSVDEHTPPRSITGVLLDPSGAAVTAAHVLLLRASPSGEILARTTTDAVGAFRLESVAPGKYTLQFHAGGLRDTSLNVVVTSKLRCA